jgi:hypothetical protein
LRLRLPVNLGKAEKPRFLRTPGGGFSKTSAFGKATLNLEQAQYFSAYFPNIFSFVLTSPLFFSYICEIFHGQWLSTSGKGVFWNIFPARRGKDFSG